MKLLFIQTGGTIDKDYPKKTDGWAFEIKDPAVKRILKKISPSFEYDIMTATKKDSLEINEIDRKLISIVSHNCARLQLGYEKKHYRH